MISSVSFEKTTYNELPYKFEAGTPNIAGVIGLGAAIDYLQGVGLSTIAEYENDLLSYATTKLAEVGNFRLIGNASNKSSVISFLLGELHPFDVGTILDQLGIAVRTGHHCCQPLMKHFKVTGTSRISFGNPAAFQSSPSFF